MEKSPGYSKMISGSFRTVYVKLFCVEYVLWKKSKKRLWVVYESFSGASDGWDSAYNVGDLGLVPGLGRSPGEGHGNPLQYSCLENSMDRWAWQATVHGVTKSWIWLSNWHTHTHTHTQYMHLHKKTLKMLKQKVLKVSRNRVPGHLLLYKYL